MTTHEDARVHVPTGVVPKLSDFTKQVWRYRDGNGQSVLTAPPDIFTLVLDDAGDAACVEDAVKLLRDRDGFDYGTRVEIRWVTGAHHVVFHDLEVLHTFLRLLSAKSGGAASDVAAFVLGALGFRWG